MTNQIHSWRPGSALPACTLLLLLCIAPASADVIVYFQPPTLSGALYASQNDVGGFGNFASLYDDFVIFPQVPFYLNDVHWYGGYFNPPAHGHITGWTISIYADAALAPGGLLWTEHFANDASESFIGNFGGFPFYAYHEDDIGKPVLAEAKYTLLVVFGSRCLIPAAVGMGNRAAGRRHRLSGFLRQQVAAEC
jgi:hypothetical protein